MTNSTVDKLLTTQKLTNFLPFPTAIPRIAETSQFEKSEKKLKIYLELMY